VGCFPAEGLCTRERTREDIEPAGHTVCAPNEVCDWLVSRQLLSDPEKGFLLAYLTLILYTIVIFVRPQEWVPFMLGLPILDFVVGFALLAWLAHILQREWRLKDAPQNWLMLGFFVAILMSHVRHTYLTALIESFQVFGKVVLVYFLYATLLNSVKRVKTIIAVMVLGCLFMSFHGILQAHTGAGFGGAPPIVDAGVTRVRALGFFNDPNDLALMLVCIVPFLVSTVFYKGSAAPARVASAASLVPILYCVYLTNSRGGWLALAATAAVYTFTHIRNKKVGVALVLAVIPLVVALGPSRMGAVSTSEKTAQVRLAFWGQGNRMLKQWPVFGAGKGRFTEFSEYSMVAHNSFVHCWAELGLFGYFFWLGLLFADLKDGWAYGKIESEEPEVQQIVRLGKASTASLTGFLAAAFFLSRTYVIPLYLILALFAALRNVYERQIGPLERGFSLSDYKYILGLELASIPAFYVLLRLLNAM